MTIAYIGFPMSLGADKKGVELAPDYFRHEGVIKMMSEITGCNDFGNVYSSITDEKEHAASPSVKYLNTVVDATTRLRNVVLSAIREGFFPFLVGGDHSLGLGSVAGVDLAYDDIGVVWFDAHGDFNTEKTSYSGNVHGMPCAALMGWCTSSLNSVVSRPIDSRRFYWIGTRSLDAGEVRMAKEHNLHIASTEEVRCRGMNGVLDDMRDYFLSQHINKVHLSVDIDAMDPSIVQGTGTKVPHGLSNEDFYVFIDKVFASMKVVSIDFVEYNKLLDDSYMATARWCLDAIRYLTQKIKNL